jgi:organic hydroperoxide reductase OsmC/OhrA
MKPFPHTYDVNLAGGPSGHAWLSAEDFPDLSTAPPVEFDGPGDAWTPEHLFLASVQTCFLFTLRAVARASKVEFVSIEVGATGTVDRRDGVTRFTEIVIRPHLVIPPGTDRERALHVIEKSEKHCLVTASLSTPVRLEATVMEAAGAGAHP